ncbi:MAG TPA: CoA transferase subunit A [Conexibacter sp.]|nr:CoA transferase subunit A [Conexibacter sp.]
MGTTKVAASAAEALRDVADGATVAVGGFGLCGIPQDAIAALRDRGVRGLTVVSNNCGVDDFGLGLLLENRQIDRMVASYVGENKRFEQQLLSGELAVELIPQGTLAERLRAGGAGIPAFYTPAGAGTPVADGKETRDFGGRPHLLEHAIVADVALVRAWKGDALGNLVYRRTARNFNPLVAMAGRVTVAEVEELVEVGELDGDQIHTPGLFVQRIFAASAAEKRIERRTVAVAPAAAEVAA